MRDSRTPEGARGREAVPVPAAAFVLEAVVAGSQRGLVRMGCPVVEGLGSSLSGTRPG